MSNKQPLLFLIITLLFTASQSYPTCQAIEIDEYQYDLTQLPNSDIFKLQTNNAYISFDFCSPKACGSEFTFLPYTENNVCYPYTSNFSPMKENYTIIDSNAPKKGIRISYLPYYDSTTSTYRNVVLNIYCPDVVSSEKSCKRTNDLTTNSTIECNYPSNAGCATLQLNYFWQFLSDNAIVFAILLWIIAIFELLFGYLAIRMTIFVFGILSGSIFGIIYTAENYKNFIYESEGYGIAVFVICLSVLMGILFGVTLLTLPRIGYINIGLWVAFIFSLLLQNSVLYLTGSLLAFYITVGVVGLIMTMIAMMKLKNYIILSTAFISAFWLVRPLGFFLPYYPNQFLSGDVYLLNSTANWQFYLYLISIIILTILGAVFQFCCFKKSASGNQAYYLEEEGTLKEKFKKLLQFQEIRHFIKSGADQLRFFKQLIVDESEDEQGPRKNKKVKTINHSEQQDQVSQMKEEQWSEDQKSAGRKKTKIQKELEDYQMKRPKKQEQNKKVNVYFPQKQKNTLQGQKRNRKVVQVPVQEEGSQQENQKSQEEESEDIKPNKLISNYRRR